MTKWVGILGLSMVLVGCDNAPQDLVAAKESAEARPDTIIVKDGVTVEVFKPKRPGASTNDEVRVGSSDTARELTRLRELGYEVDTSTPMVARGKAPDGRTVNVTWFPATDAAGVESAILHVQANGHGSMLALDGRDVGPGAAGKGDRRPAQIDASPCRDLAKALFRACVSGCFRRGFDAVACHFFCFVAAVSLFIYCYFTSL